jgi:heat shock protein HslJ
LRGQNRLAVSNLFSTKMFCEKMDLETQLLTILETAEGFNLNGDSLYIYNEQTKTAAKFVAVYMK